MKGRSGCGIRVAVCAAALAIFSVCGLRESCGQVQMVVQGSASGVTSVAISPDGKYVLTGTDGSVARLWEADSGRLLREFRDSGALGTNSVAFSPDGSQILCGGGVTGGIRLWETKTGRPIRGFKDSKGAGQLSADGTMALAGTDILKPFNGAVRVWDTRTGALLHEYKNTLMPAVFSPDGRSIFAATWPVLSAPTTGAPGKQARDYPIVQLDVQSGTEIRRFTGHTDRISTLTLSADGRTLVTASNDLTVRTWDASSGKELRRKQVDGMVRTVAVSPDQSLLFVATVHSPDLHGTAELWDLATGVRVRTLEGFTAWINGASFSPDGRVLTAGGADTGARAWDVRTGKQWMSYGGRTVYMAALAELPDGDLMTTGASTSIWSAATGAEAQRYADSGLAIAVSPDGRYALMGSSEVKATAQILDIATWKPVAGLLSSKDAVVSVDVSADGRLGATASNDGYARIWDMASGKLLRELHADPVQVHGVRFSPDASFVVTTGQYHTVRLWQVSTGQEMLHMEDSVKTATGEVQNQVVQAVAVSPDGRLIATSDDYAFTVRIWDAKTGAELHRMVAGNNETHRLSFSRDGSILLGACYDGTARLWDAATGRLIEEIPGFTGGLMDAMFLHDERWIYLATVDGAVLWDRKLKKKALTMLSIAGHGWAVVAPDGRFDTSELDGGAPLNWVMDDDPMHALPLEIFMRDYYTPGLLARVLKGETLPPIRSIAEIKNRVQPVVSVKSVTPSKKMAGRVDVVVHAASHTDDKGVASGLQDLRLFRDGQMVAGGYLEGPLKDGNLTFKNVMLKSGAKKVTFTAYAFNSERIKSETASLDYEPPATVAAAAGKPRAYLLQIGVNHVQAEGCELQYSGNDAEKMSAVLKTRLEAQGMAVEPVVLESPTGGDAQGASKQKIHAAIAAIAAKATPDDAFFLSFSGHGYASLDGQYYIIPSDLAGSCLHIDKTLLASAISADELAEWLRPLDAGEMAFVLDACHSAESVEAGDFRPGPMGSRGLGQLAYDKRMRILVASQAREVAVEYDQLQQGLLSYVLTQDGLRRGEADWKPVDHQITVGEWLSYAANAVPKFDVSQAQAARGLRVLGDASDATSGQVPAVFDFSKSDGMVLQRLPGQP